MEAEKLEWAIKNGEVEQVKQILEEGSPELNRPRLCIAADYGQYEVLKLLLEKGENINEKDKHGITPLLSAIYEGHEKCVQLLLEKGANKNELAPDGSTYLACAETDAVKNLLK